VATPPALIVATLVLLLAQVNVSPVMAAPVESLAAAVKVWVAPTAIEGAAGDTVMEASVGVVVPPELLVAAGVLPPQPQASRAQARSEARPARRRSRGRGDEVMNEVFGLVAWHRKRQSTPRALWRHLSLCLSRARPRANQMLGSGNPYMAPTTPPSEERLDSWKAIAGYLDRQVRTVQRWEKEEGLPVHRLPHKKQGSVYAYKSELDAWRQRSQAVVEASAPPAPAVSGKAGTRRWVTGALAAGLVLVVAAAWWYAGRPRVATPTAPPAWGRLFANATREGGAPRLIALGPAPRTALLSPDGRTLWVGDAQDGSLSLVDTQALRVRAVLRPGGALGPMAITPDGLHLYAGRAGDSQLEVVDVATLAVKTLATSGVVTDMALSPGGRTLYLALQYAGLDALDTASLTFRHISGPACPSYLAMAPDGKQLYIVYQCGGWGGRSGHDAIGIWDVGRRELVGRLLGPPQVGSALALPRDGSELWAGMGDACVAPGYDHIGCAPGQRSGINVYSLGEQRPLRSLPLNAPPQSITFLSGDTRVAVTGGGVSIYDATRMAELEHFATATPGNLVVAKDGKRSFLPLTRQHALAVLEASPANCAPPSAELLGWWRGDGTAADAWGMNHGRWSGTPDAATWRRHEQVRAPVAGERRPATALPQEGRLQQEVAVPPYAPGRVGQALRFSGGNTLTLGHDSTLLSGESVALSLWVKPEGVAGVLASKYDAATGRGWQLRALPDGRLAWCTGSGQPGACGAQAGARLATLQPAAAGQWVQVAVTAAQGAGEIYINGRRVAAAAMNLRHLEAPPADMVLGGEGWRGLMDEVLYYSHLSPAGIRQLAAMPACMVGPQ
jgi:hypothetical protein